MNVDIPSIQASLRLLRDPGKISKTFGSDTHHFQTHPPLSEQTVRKFERRHKITLSRGYRDFLIHVGNGGAGPGYGLFKLGEMDDGWEFKPWKENGGFVGILSQPFPHTGPWNDLSEEPPYDESRADDPERENDFHKRLNAWEDRVYWNTANVNGAIPICHLGCAHRQWLVVTGAETGNVWDDTRTDKGGLKPLRGPTRDRVTFLEWYGSWLDQALQQLE